VREGGGNVRETVCVRREGDREEREKEQSEQRQRG
jgi:hypothetical protein